MLEPAAPRVRCWHGCVRGQGVTGMAMVKEGVSFFLGNGGEILLFSKNYSAKNC